MSTLISLTALLLTVVLAYQVYQSFFAIRIPLATAGVRFNTLTAARNILGIFLTNKVLVLLSACLAFILIFNESLGPLEALYKVLFRWDTDRYLRIAEYGYETSGHFEATIVFYPFYPLLIKFFQIVVHNYFVAGLLVSFAASFFSCIYLYRLCMLEFGKESVACTAVLLMLLCPTSIFFNMAYTESVFIFLTISTFYYFRTDCYVWAGIFAFCAALTKNQGVLLAIPFGFAGLHTYLTNQNIQHKPLIFLPTVFCLAGFGVYLLINKVMYGEWLKFMYYQQAGYSNSFGFFIHNLSGMYAMMLQENNMVMRYGTWVLSLITFLLLSLFSSKGLAWYLLFIACMA